MAREGHATPTRNYDIVCKVGKKDISEDLVQLGIVSSVELPYRTYILDLFLDPDDMILEKIYGQEPIQLSIRVLNASPGGVPYEVTQVNLMALGSKYDLLIKDSQPQVPDKIRSAIRIRCVPLEGYAAMTSFVNGVYLGETLEDVVEDLADQCGANIVYDSLSQNETKIDQIIVPPAPLYKTLKYLDRTFGFFDGLAAITSSSVKSSRKSNSAILADIKPTIYIKNLSAKKKFSNIKITQLSTDNKKQEEEYDVFDGKEFYTRDPVETEYSGNTIFSVYGTTMKHVVKPRDELYRTIELDTSEFADKYGITTKKNQTFFSKKGQAKRISFFKDHTGYDDKETHIRAIHSKYFSQMSILKITLSKWLILKNLINIGEGVIFKSNITDLRDLTGNYVSKFCLFNFVRAKREWECGATLHLIRTNRIR